MPKGERDIRFRWVLVKFAAVVLGVGAPLGVAWAKLAHLPGYTLSDQLVAGMSERGLADVFSADALFVLLAIVSGVAIGLVAWFWFRDRGWWVCATAVLGALGVSLVMWQVGLAIAPPTFDQRLAEASAGDVIHIDLALHSLAALLVGPFSAITPVMLLAAFWPEGSPMDQSPLEARRVAAVD